MVEMEVCEDGGEGKRDMKLTSSELVEKLKLEMSILADGGHGRSVRTPWRAMEYFRDSVTCLNFGKAKRVHQRAECLLSEFVNSSHKNDAIPCHLIPLNPQGETIESLLRTGDLKKLEELLLDWLDRTIRRLETESTEGSML